MKNIAVVIIPLVSGMLCACASAATNSNRPPSFQETTQALSAAAQEVSPEEEYDIGRAVAAALIKHYGIFDDQPSFLYLAGC